MQPFSQLSSSLWMAADEPWPDPVTEPVSPGTICRNFSVTAHTVTRPLFIRAKKLISNRSLAFHLCLPSNPNSKKRKINLGMFSYFNAHSCQSSQWLSTLLIKQDVPAHMQMSSNVKHVGGNLYSPSQARCAETKEKILTTERKALRTCTLSPILPWESCARLVFTPIFPKMHHSVLRSN